MKKTLFIITIATVLSSCCTIFTASKQNVTFRAPNGTKIYDVETNVKIAEVEKDNMVTTKIKKKISDKQKENKKQYSEYFGEVTQDGKGFVFAKLPEEKGKFKLTIRRYKTVPTTQNDRTADGEMNLCYQDTKTINLK